MDTTPGTPCSVRRWRCICKEGEWPPNRPLEAFNAIVDRVGLTGMVYLKRSNGTVAVVHPEECFPVAHAPESEGNRG